MKNYLYNLATDKSVGLIPATLRLFLFIISLIYGLAVRILIPFFSFCLYHASCRVVSVGNITLGGTGKTSLVEFIARQLKKEGQRIAIISRGYKKRITSCENMGDEPYMLSKKLEDIPVIVEADRVKGIKKALKDYSVDTVILDDAFQQWGIKKDLEIVAIDATNPFGNFNMIPRGILREPLSSLKRADIFIITKTNLMADTQGIKNNLAGFNPSALIFESRHLPLAFYDIERPSDLFSTESLKGKSVTLFSGIGDPASFEKLISNIGIKIGLSFRFADHHHYSDKDLDKIIQGSKEKNIDTIITTEKDTARMDKLQINTYGLKLLTLRIELAINDEQGFRSRLLNLYSL